MEGCFPSRTQQSQSRVPGYRLPPFASSGRLAEPAAAAPDHIETVIRLLAVKARSVASNNISKVRKEQRGSVRRASAAVQILSAAAPAPSAFVLAGVA
jgi:hypothetical protein